MEEPSHFSLGQAAQSLTCSINEKPHTGLDDCLRMLLSEFRKRMSAQEQQRREGQQVPVQDGGLGAREQAPRHRPRPQRRPHVLLGVGLRHGQDREGATGMNDAQSCF